VTDARISYASGEIFYGHDEAQRAAG